jgi:hypothetical protein
LNKSKKPRAEEVPALSDGPGHCNLGISRGAGDTRPGNWLADVDFGRRGVGNVDGGGLSGGGGGCGWNGDDGDGGKNGKMSLEVDFGAFFEIEGDAGDGDGNSDACKVGISRLSDLRNDLSGKDACGGGGDGGDGKDDKMGLEVDSGDVPGIEGGACGGDVDRDRNDCEGGEWAYMSLLKTLSTVVAIAKAVRKAE